MEFQEIYNKLQDKIIYNYDGTPILKEPYTSIELEGFNKIKLHLLARKLNEKMRPLRITKNHLYLIDGIYIYNIPKIIAGNVYYDESTHGIKIKDNISDEMKAIAALYVIPFEFDLAYLLQLCNAGIIGGNVIGIENKIHQFGLSIIFKISEENIFGVDKISEKFRDNKTKIKVNVTDFANQDILKYIKIVYDDRIEFFDYMPNELKTLANETNKNCEIILTYLELNEFNSCTALSKKQEIIEKLFGQKNKIISKQYSKFRDNEDKLLNRYTDSCIKYYKLKNYIIKTPENKFITLKEHIQMLFEKSVLDLQFKQNVFNNQNKFIKKFIST